MIDTPLKNWTFEDLLERPPIKYDNPKLEKSFKNKTILVTGAAGSIGSQIVKNLCEYELKELILIDQNETGIFELTQSLIKIKKFQIDYLVADVTDIIQMKKIFDKKINIIFHAAAYKHVPLMERDPREAVKNNILGTILCSDLSIKTQVEKFIFISSDKAVNPTNIMGATKRVCELYISSLAQTYPKTKFVSTRFGNVLGSRGSVVPTFIRQIFSGGPVTVTHKNITRYFMTIPEASKLVLEASSIADKSEIFVFDMGKPVKILDLAKKMIKLCGFNYPDDIDIKITGLRQGEKLYEELLTKKENINKTSHLLIFKSKIQRDLTKDYISLTKKLLNSIDIDSSQQIVDKIRYIVPEFISNNSKWGSKKN